MRFVRQGRVDEIKFDMALSDSKVGRSGVYYRRRKIYVFESETRALLVAFSMGIDWTGCRRPSVESYSEKNRGQGHHLARARKAKLNRNFVELSKEEFEYGFLSNWKNSLKFNRPPM